MKPEVRYRTRPVRYLETLESDGWRLKLYGISAAEEPREQFLEAAKRVAFDDLPEPDGDGRYGVGFVIAHDGEDGCWVLVDWWQYDEILCQNLYRATKEAPGDLVPNTEKGLLACVWELEVIAFERRAWLDSVLKNQAGPDLDGYMESTLNTRV